MNQNIRVFKKRLQIAEKKWNAVQAQSIKAINTILGTLSRLNLIQQRGAFSEDLLAKFPDVPERISFHLAELINKSIHDLNIYLSQLNEIVNEMRKIEEQFRQDYLLIIKTQYSEGNQSWSHDLETLEQAERTFQEIVDMYDRELSLRKEILSTTQNSSLFQPNSLIIYLTLWAGEIYIEHNRIHELIEEFMQAEKVCERVLQSQDSMSP
ncbi:MAG: hypothetical protein EAX86_07430 [Candidatus Heimdallarchaeota archaeon]|nr:hypothetical protein [Candidatus Heimdallarchaeota archaeon]